jgi:hypothetical protein
MKEERGRRKQHERRVEGRGSSMKGESGMRKQHEGRVEG